MIRIVKKKGELMFFNIQYDLFPANKDDKRVIKDLFEEGVKIGAYETTINDNELQFNRMLESMVSGLPFPDQYGRAVSTLSCKDNNTTIGFMTIAVDQIKKEVELWYFSLLSSIKNKGKGQKFLEVLFKMLKRETPDYKLFARCKDSSVEISHLLNKNKFIKERLNSQVFNFYYCHKI